MSHCSGNRCSVPIKNIRSFFSNFRSNFFAKWRRGSGGSRAGDPFAPSQLPPRSTFCIDAAHRGAQFTPELNSIVRFAVKTLISAISSSPSEGAGFSQGLPHPLGPAPQLSAQSSDTSLMRTSNFPSDSIQFARLRVLQYIAARRVSALLPNPAFVAGRIESSNS
jgi:hypothetical protein